MLKTLAFVVATFLALIALLFIHAPYYVEVMWLSNQRYPNIPDQSWPSVKKPTCDAEVSNAATFSRIDSPNLINRTCTVDVECMVWNWDCQSYCAPNGFCKNQTGVPCNGGTEQGPYDQQCVFDQFYRSPGNPYPPWTSAAAELQKASSALTVWLNAQQSDYYLLMRLMAPPYLLLVLGYIPNLWSSWWGALPALFMGLFMLTNFVQCCLYLWIITSIVDSVIFPPQYAFGVGATPWQYTAAQLVCAGTWFIWVAQIIYFVLIVLWFRTQPKADQGLVDFEELPGYGSIAGKAGSRQPLLASKPQPTNQSAED